MIVTLKGADFSGSNIGTLETYLVSKSIGIGVEYAIPSYVIAGASVNWALTLKKDYSFGEYNVTMGDTTIIPTVVDGTMTINIPKVTGDISIAVATQLAAPELGLDTVIYDGKTYREIFINNNAAPDINNNSMVSIIAGTYYDSSGTTSIVSDSTAAANYVPPYSLSVSGTSSQQARSTNYFPKTKRFFLAANIKVTAYTKGYIGVIFSSDFSGCINRVTDGWEVIAGISAGENSTDSSGLFIGSASSANLTGRINNPVAVDISIFSKEPTIAELTAIYKQYNALLIKGYK